MNDVQKYIELIRTQATNPTDIKPMKKVLNREILTSSLFSTVEFGERFVYKISDPKTSMHNLLMAQILLKNNIPVPDSKIFISGGTYFEKYKIIPGITASLVMANDLLTHNQILDILTQALTLDKKISTLGIENTALVNDLVLCDRRYKHHIKTYGKFIANVYYHINKRQTMSGNVTLHHYDLNPANILLDENNNIRALLDLDSIAICDEYAALTQILSFWPMVTVDEIAKIYTQTFQRDIDTKRLTHLLKFRRTRDIITTKLRNIKSRKK